MERETQNKQPEQPRTSSLEETKARAEYLKENPLLVRKMLIIKPFSYVDPKTDEYKTFHQVPAVFQVIERNEYWTKLADANGEPLGKIETAGSVEALPWHTRMVLRPKPGEKFSYYKNEEHIGKMKGGEIAFTAKNDVVCPILKTKELDGAVFAYIGPPLGDEMNAADSPYPIWISLRNDKREHATQVGLLASRDEIVRYASQLDLAIRGLKLSIDPNKRRDVDPLLSSLRAKAFMLLTGQPPSHLSEEDAQSAMEKIFPREVFAPLEIKSKDVETFRSKDMEVFIKRLEGSLSTLLKYAEYLDASSDKRPNLMQNLTRDASWGGKGEIYSLTTLLPRPNEHASRQERIFVPDFQFFP